MLVLKIAAMIKPANSRHKPSPSDTPSHRPHDEGNKAKRSKADDQYHADTPHGGDIAKKLGGVELSRDVGQALGRNPCPIVVPCHRVLAAGNKPGGFSANGGVVTKLKMLAIEGAVVNHTPNLFD